MVRPCTFSSVASRAVRKITGTLIPSLINRCTKEKPSYLSAIATRSVMARSSSTTRTRFGSAPFTVVTGPSSRGSLGKGSEVVGSLLGLHHVQRAPSLAVTEWQGEAANSATSLEKLSHRKGNRGITGGPKRPLDLGDGER